VGKDKKGPKPKVQTLVKFPYPQKFSSRNSKFFEKSGSIKFWPIIFFANFPFLSFFIKKIFCNFALQ
jgi:hypothetical protein